MLRNGPGPAPRTLRMLRLGRESQHPYPESQPPDFELQHPRLNSEHICSLRRLPGLDLEHIGRMRLPRQKGMLLKSDVFLPGKLEMMRIAGNSEHPAL